MAFGVGDYRYEVVEGWGAAHPLGIVSAQAVDATGKVYVVDREPNHEVAVFDRDGAFVTRWGGDQLQLPHSIWIHEPSDGEPFALIADVGSHTVDRYALDGTHLGAIGTRDVPGSLGTPFNRPTWAVEAPWGDLYVSDGYGQNFVHRFAADGELIHTWGGEGSGPAEFDLPHCIKIDPRERLLVIDRSNGRVQLFDREGTFIEEWTDAEPANDLFIDENDVVHLVEAQGRVTLFDLDGQVLGRWGERGDWPGQFVGACHSIWIDDRGDLYIGEVPYVADRLQKFARV